MLAAIQKKKRKTRTRLEDLWQWKWQNQIYSVTARKRNHRRVTAIMYTAMVQSQGKEWTSTNSLLSRSTCNFNSHELVTNKIYVYIDIFHENDSRKYLSLFNFKKKKNIFEHKTWFNNILISISDRIDHILYSRHIFLSCQQNIRFEFQIKMLTNSTYQITRSFFPVSVLGECINWRNPKTFEFLYLLFISDCEKYFFSMFCLQCRVSSLYNRQYT